MSIIRKPFMNPLVLAIAAGEKTETRRLLRPQPTEPILWYPSPKTNRSLAYDGDAHFRRGVAIDFGPANAGDILYVCEALVPIPGMERNEPDVVGYRCDFTETAGRVPWPWKVRSLSARYCPTWAVRHRRRLLSVTPERLSEITDEGARAEGIERLGWKPTREAFINGFLRMYPDIGPDPWVWVYKWSPEAA